MNEHLLYIQAWWGRMVASEMVFDVLDGRFLYRKLANYGVLADPECGTLQKQASRLWPGKAWFHLG
jgi:hypothetical protein